MGRQLSRPLFPNSFFCLFIPCFIRLEGQSVDRTVREWSVGRSVGRSVVLSVRQSQAWPEG